MHVCPSCGRKHYHPGSEYCPEHRETRPAKHRQRVGACIDELACGIDWGPLDHRHCPQPECGRPMSPAADVCSLHAAVEILIGPRVWPATEGWVSAHDLPIPEFDPNIIPIGGKTKNLGPSR